jgi:hypothetical protein
MLVSVPLIVGLSAFAAEGKAKEQVIREVERGLFVKSNIGSTVMLAPAGYLSGVMSVQLGLGQEFIDKENLSVAWEADFHQSLFNGPVLEALPLVQPVVQGDIHVFGGLAGLEASFYPTRRLGIGAMAQGGVFLAPVLMEPTAYAEEVVPIWGVEPTANAGPIPVVGITPTLEYYTKLSHFSVGVDVAALYWVTIGGFGLTPTGYLKYTF